MWDHPLGVGWNKTMEIYEEYYSPPDRGAGAIMTNDYLMIGTQLGVPALICFVTYCALCLRKQKAEDGSQKAENASVTLDSTKTACCAGALAMLVEFGFDGGLFKLATASVFWILLEIGSSRSPIHYVPGIVPTSVIGSTYS
jgi:hypothetical protein